MSDNYSFDVIANIQDSLKNVESFADEATKAAKSVQSQFTNLGETITGGLSSAFTSLAGLAGTVLAGFTLKEAIAQAAKFEQEVLELNVALGATGQATEKNVEGFVNYAKALQQTTKFSDDTVITTATLIQNLGELSQGELKRATKAALDLSVALGIDASTAATLLGKAANGNIATFARYGISIQKGTDNAKTFANALDVLESRFGGDSEKAVNTFAGSIAQLHNNIDDTLKSFGEIIITNQSVIELVKIASQGFIAFSEVIVNNKDAISSFVTNGIKLVSDGLSILPELLASATAGFVAFFFFTSAGNIAAVIAMGGGITGLASALISAGAAAAYSAAEFLINPLFVSVAAVAALAGFVVHVIRIRDQFVSLADAISATTTQLISFFARLVGATEAAGRLDQTVQGLKDKKVILDTKPALDSIEELSKAAKAYRATIGDNETAQRIAAEKAQAQFKIDNAALIKTITTTLANAGLSQAQILVNARADQLKIIADGEALGNITRSEANKLRLEAQSKFQQDFGKLTDDGNAKNIEKAKKEKDLEEKIVADGSKNILGFLEHFSEAIDKFDSTGTLAIFSGAVANSIKDGAQGAQKFITGVLTAGAEAALGPAGKALEPVFDLLTQGPDAVKGLVTAFTGAIPTIIQNIAEAAPVLVTALVQQIPQIIKAIIAELPEIIDAFIADLPELIDALIAATPEIIAALIAESPKLILALVASGPRIALAIIQSLENLLPAGAGKFIQAIVDQAGRIVDAIAQGIANALKGIGGGAVGAVVGVGKKVGGFLGFAEGGVVPGGFPNDSLNAKLSSGEGVVPLDTMARLDKFLTGATPGSNGGNSGSGQTVVNVQIGQQNLAKIILDLNRGGYRLA